MFIGLDFQKINQSAENHHGGLNQFTEFRQCLSKPFTLTTKSILFLHNKF